MEEIIVDGTADAAGEIRINDMPPKMRYVYIKRGPELINGIVVNYTNLPESLEEIRVTSSYNERGMKRKITAVGKPGKVKLETKYDAKYPKKKARSILGRFRSGSCESEASGRPF